MGGKTKATCSVYVVKLLNSCREVLSSHQEIYWFCMNLELSYRALQSCHSEWYPLQGMPQNMCRPLQSIYNNNLTSKRKRWTSASRSSLKIPPTKSVALRPLMNSHTLFKSRSSHWRPREFLSPKAEEIRPEEAVSIIGKPRRMSGIASSSRITSNYAKWRDIRK